MIQVPRFAYIPFAMGNEIKAKPISDLALLANKRSYQFPYKVCMGKIFWKMEKPHKTLYKILIILQNLQYNNIVHYFIPLGSSLYRMVI